MLLRSCVISHAVALAIMIAGAGQARSADDGCEYGRTATVTGLLDKVYEFGKETKQWGLPLADPGTCEVDTIYSRNPVPANCVAGANITAEGTLEESDGETVALGEVTSLACTP